MSIVFFAAISSFRDIVSQHSMYTIALNEAQKSCEVRQRWTATLDIRSLCRRIYGGKLII